MKTNRHDQYFQHYSCAEVTLLNDFPANYQRVLVIPAYAEPVEQICYLTEFVSQTAGSLLILVANVPDNASKQAVITTRAATEWLYQHHPPQWQRQHLSLHMSNQSGVLLVQRIEQPIPEQQGVGMARKIGADIAAWLVVHNRVEQPWFHCSDADVIFPDDYWLTAMDADLAIYPFVHQCNSHLACLLYELHLHYYVAGLRFAGSHYGWHTIGSLFVVAVDAYLQVRGFPRRSAGEDFYLLNKICKIGTICDLSQHKPLLLSGRVSQRTPFGTGKAIAAISDCANPVQHYRFYHPQIFQQLRDWLDFLPQLAMVMAHQPLSVQQQLESCHDSLWYSILQQMGINDFLRKVCRQKLSPPQAELALRNWFDGLKTVQFVHRLRDSHFQSVSLTQWAQLYAQNSELHAAAIDNLLQQLCHVDDYNCE